MCTRKISFMDSFNTNRPRKRWETTGRNESVLRSLLAGENGEAN